MHILNLSIPENEIIGVFECRTIKETQNTINYREISRTIMGASFNRIYNYRRVKCKIYGNQTKN